MELGTCDATSTPSSSTSTTTPPNNQKQIGPAHFPTDSGRVRRPEVPTSPAPAPVADTVEGRAGDPIGAGSGTQHPTNVGLRASNVPLAGDIW